MSIKPRIVIIGAGATGRGHIGEVAHSAGWDITFIERDWELAKRLSEGGRYSVRLAMEPVRDVEISGFRVLHTDEPACAEAIADADVVATAVLPTNLRSTAPTLAAGLALRANRSTARPLNVIACENMERSSSTLYEYLKQEAPDLDWDYIDGHVGFPDSMIARAVPTPKEDPIRLIAEAGQEWSVDAKAVREPMPRMAGMTLSANQEAALERKLYIKNTGHFAIALFGYRKGYRLMDEAQRDPEIYAQVDAATGESAAAVVSKHGFPPDEIEAYRRGFLECMKSPLLPDDILRVVREPLRKLTREERLVGPAMLAHERGLSTRNLARLVAATLATVLPGDAQSAELQRRIERSGVERILQDVCGIPKGHPLAVSVSEAYDSLRG